MNDFITITTQEGLRSINRRYIISIFPCDEGTKLILDPLTGEHGMEYTALEPYDEVVNRYLI